MTNYAHKKEMIKMNKHEPWNMKRETEIIILKMKPEKWNLRYKSRNIKSETWNIKHDKLSKTSLKRKYER